MSMNCQEFWVQKKKYQFIVYRFEELGLAPDPV